ncbi:MAG: hypothetical protein HQ537_01830, partial [Parcubacteria group bacterium]|nr:hypothetical protein [Parcubacteria group bacterium]
METNNKEQLNAIRLRQSKQKKAIIEQLKKIPVINVACARAVVGRASFYRWLQEDDGFKKAVEEAMAEGESFINDMSESQIITLIKEKNWSAIRFWLTNHHPKYANKLEVITNIKQEELNEEQEATVRNALK